MRWMSDLLDANHDYYKRGRHENSMYLFHNVLSSLFTHISIWNKNWIELDLCQILTAFQILFENS